MSTATQSTLVNSRTEVGFRNVLLPTDFSDASLAALPELVEIARRFGSDVYVAHIYLPPSYPNVPAAVATSILEQEREAAHRQLQVLLNRQELRDLRAHGLFLMGSPIDGLLDIIREKHIDLVIMATHGRTGFRRLVLGSVTEGVVRHSPCPVLTVPVDRVAKEAQ